MGLIFHFAGVAFWLYLYFEIWVRENTEAFGLTYHQWHRCWANQCSNVSAQVFCVNDEYTCSTIFENMVVAEAPTSDTIASAGYSHLPDSFGDYVWPAVILAGMALLWEFTLACFAVQALQAMEMSEAVDVGAHLALQVQKDSMDAVRDESPRSPQDRKKSQSRGHATVGAEAYGHFSAKR